jgi:hypothetical protein
LNFLELEFLWDRLQLVHHSKYGSLELRSLGSYGGTAKETHPSTSSVSLALALSWICASTNRLPRNFHIGCCVGTGLLRVDLPNRYRRNAFATSLVTGIQLNISQYSSTWPNFLQLLGRRFQFIKSSTIAHFSIRPPLFIDRFCDNLVSEDKLLFAPTKVLGMGNQRHCPE